MSLLELLASLRVAQPQWDLHLVLGGDGPLVDKVSQLRIPVTVLPLPPRLAQLGDSALAESPKGRRLRVLSSFLHAGIQTIQYTRQLSAIVQSFKPDLIHTTGFKMHLLGAWARPSGVPVIWHIHDYVTSRPVMKRLLRWNSHRCAAMIANSRSVAADVQAVCRRPAVTVVYNAVDLQTFSPTGTQQDLDGDSGLPPASKDTIRIGLAATFARWKGHKVFLKAISLLPREMPLRAYIIGGPIYQTQGSQCTLQELREDVSRLGLSGRVGFTRFSNEAASALRALDIVVHASTAPEPFGMVIAEGMACGKPVVASAASGAAELFEDGENVLGYPCGDVEALAAHLSRLVSDQELRTRLGSAARNSAEKHFHPSRLVPELTAVYLQARSFDVNPARGVVDRDAVASV